MKTANRWWKVRVLFRNLLWVVSRDHLPWILAILWFENSAFWLVWVSSYKFPSGCILSSKSERFSKPNSLIWSDILVLKRRCSFLAYSQLQDHKDYRWTRLTVAYWDRYHFRRCYIMAASFLSLSRLGFEQIVIYFWDPMA